MSELPADAVPIIDWPEYAITPDGQVWRVIGASDVRKRGQWGSVPRQLKVQMMGGRFETKKSPAVKLSRHGALSCRTIRSLVRQHFGD